MFSPVWVIFWKDGESEGIWYIIFPYFYVSMRRSVCILHCLLLFFIGYHPLFSQNKKKVEEYLKTIEMGKRDTNLIIAYNELATELLGSDDNKAKEFAFSGLQLSKELKHVYNESWALNLIGLSYDYLAKPDSALYFYQEAIKLKKSIKDLNGIGSVYSNIGVMYYFQNDFEKAIYYYNKAQQQYELTKNEKGISGIYNNLGAIYRQQKKYEQAIASYESSLKIKEKLGDSTGISNALGNLGAVYQYMGDYNKAEKFLFKSIFIDSLRSNKSSLVSSFITLAEVNYYRKNYKEAQKNLERALILSKEVNAIHYMDDAYRLYSTIDSVSGDYKSALTNYQLYEYYKGLVSQQDRSQQLDKLETIFLTKEKEQQIKLLNANAEIKELKIKEQKEQLIIFVVVSTLLILLLIAFVWAYKNIRKKGRELQLKNEIINSTLNEKEILLKEIHHRVKNNLQVVSSLLSVQSRYIKDEKALDAINESRERVNAISLLHQEIYSNEVLKRINAASYLSNLAFRIGGAMDLKKNVGLHLDIDEIQLDIDQMIPLGLIVNELLTNSYKYGCSNPAPQIEFSFKANANKILLVIKDNGKGIAVEKANEESDSLGLKLVKLFSAKLKGELKIENNNGTIITLNFEMKNG